MGKDWGRILIGVRREKLVIGNFFDNWTLFLVQGGMRDGDGVAIAQAQPAHCRRRENGASCAARLTEVRKRDEGGETSDVPVEITWTSISPDRRRTSLMIDPWRSSVQRERFEAPSTIWVAFCAWAKPTSASATFEDPIS